MDAEEIDPVLWLQDRSIVGALNDIPSLLESPALLGLSEHRAYFMPVLISLLISMNDVLKRADREKVRVAFTDDVQVDGKINDVTDLIREFRNAVCHIGSPHRLIGSSAIFSPMYGKTVGIVLDGVSHGSDYEDDIAIWCGSLRLYVGRHIRRAFEEARGVLDPIVKPWPRRG